MTQRDGYPEGPAANLNIAATKFGNGGRRIDQLKAVAYDLGFTNDDARKHGKLTALDTWQKLFRAHGISGDAFLAPPINQYPVELKLESTTVTTSNQELPRQFSLLEWVDFGQALALALASVGFAVLVLGMFPRINPLNLLPVKITIQVGK